MDQTYVKNILLSCVIIKLLLKCIKKLLLIKAFKEGSRSLFSEHLVLFPAGCKVA
jgi:hypothetical protein